MIGELKTNLHKLKELSKSKVPISLLKPDGENASGRLLIKEVSTMIGPSFLKKVMEGYQFNLLIGIDSTHMYDSF